MCSATRRKSPGNDTKLRVALSMLERVGLLTRHPDSGRGLHLEMCPAPPAARAELDSLLDHCAAKAERNAIAGNAGVLRNDAVPPRPDCAAFRSCAGKLRRRLRHLSWHRSPRRQRKRDAPPRPTEDAVADIGRVLLEILQSLPFPHWAGRGWRKWRRARRTAAFR